MVVAEKGKSEMGPEAINILMVEDEEAHAEAIRRAFRQTENNFNLTWVSSIHEAFDSLQKSVPDLVITDWLLPDGKGTDLLPSGKALFPIVLMTSHGNEKLAVEAIKAGAVDYAVKSPSMFAEVPHIAKRALRQWGLFTEGKRAVEKLRESEERFRTVFEQGPLGIHMAGLDYRLISCNSAFCYIVGYSDQELSELTFMDITYSEDVDADVEEARKLLAGKMPSYKMEKRLVRKQGGMVWIHSTRSIIRDTDGKPLYFLTMVEDISERKHTEHALKQTLSELTRSNADLEQFAYVASHDLQEPLRNVASCVQLLADGYKNKLGADADQLIHYAIDSVGRMKALINDLLTFSRIGTKGKPFEEIKCNEILEETLISLESAISATGAVISYDPLPVARADGTQLLQVFQNLISNAIKFRGDEPPKVHISAAKIGSEWIFSVNDSGIGIAQRHFDRIFIIFQRLNKRTEYEGTGMGLAIVKKIVERHRGRVWVESEVGVGSTFYFTIPNYSFALLA